jgi:hypothetical protein
MIDYGLIFDGLFLALGVCAGIALFGVIVLLFIKFFGRD